MHCHLGSLLGSVTNPIYTGNAYYERTVLGEPKVETTDSPRNTNSGFQLTWAWFGIWLM